MTRRLIACALALLAVAPGRDSHAATKLEGEYQITFDARKSGRAFPWDWDTNNDDTWAGAQLRLFSQPRAGVEGFLKVEADWNSGNNNNERPVFQFREAHLRYLWSGPNRGVDSRLFSRQDRFWVDNYLIKVVDGNRLKDDNNGPNAQGIRVDTWGFKGFNTSWILSDFSHQFNPAKPTTDAARGSAERTDDAYIARVRREFFADKRLRLGWTATRKDENQLNEVREHADVLAGDVRYNFRGADVLVEYAESQSPITGVKYAGELERTISIGKRSTGLRLPSRSVLIAEVRSLRIGRTMIGYVNVIPTYWSRGPLWDNRTGDGNRDETGFNLNTYYLVPERAITFTNNYKRYSKRAFEKREETEMYNEIYIEFVNGFTGKTFLRQRDVFRSDIGVTTKDQHDDWFAEVQVESQLAWMRVQSKVKDVGQPTRKQLFAVENSVNLTSKLKVYNRFAFANDPAFLRKGIFSQLQYRPTGSMEMFLEYGPGWIGDDSTPVNDGNLEGGDNQSDLVKFILKGTF